MYVWISVVLYVGNCKLILSLYKNLGPPARCFASGLGSLGAARSLKLCLFGLQSYLTTVIYSYIYIYICCIINIYIYHIELYLTISKYIISIYLSIYLSISNYVQHIYIYITIYPTHLTVVLSSPQTIVNQTMGNPPCRIMLSIGQRRPSVWSHEDWYFGTCINIYTRINTIWGLQLFNTHKRFT